MLRAGYPAAPEELAAVEKELREPWDANEHIAKLFERTKPKHALP